MSNENIEKLVRMASVIADGQIAMTDFLIMYTADDEVDEVTLQYAKATNDLLSLINDKLIEEGTE